MPYFLVGIISLLFLQIQGSILKNADKFNAKMIEEEMMANKLYFSLNSPSLRQKRFLPLVAAVGLGAAIYHGVRWLAKRNRKKNRQNFQQTEQKRRQQMQQKNNYRRRMGNMRRASTGGGKYGRRMSSSSLGNSRQMSAPIKMNNNNGGSIDHLHGKMNAGPMPMPSPMPDPSKKKKKQQMIANAVQKTLELQAASDKLKYLADEAKKDLMSFQANLQDQLDMAFQGQMIPLSGKDTLDAAEMAELAKTILFGGNLTDPIVAKVKIADANTKFIISQMLAKSIVAAILDPITPELYSDDAIKKAAEKISKTIA